jgi:hypothetical protein
MTKILLSVVIGIIIISSTILSQTKSTNNFTISILGKVPVDEYYSTLALEIDQNNHGVLVRRDGIWVSQDRGLNWRREVEASDNIIPFILSAWPATPSHIYTISNGKAYKTTNTGKSWKIVNLGSNAGSNFYTIAGDIKSKLIILGGSRSVPIRKEELYKIPKYAQDVGSSEKEPKMFIPSILFSTNAGEDWQVPVLPKTEIGPIDNFMVSYNYIIAYGPYVILLSKDSGKSWSKISLLDSLPEDEEDTYPIGAGIFREKIWISLKNGNLYSGSIRDQKMSHISKSISPLESLVFINPCFGFARNGDLMKTEDSGATWVPIIKSKRIRALYDTQSGIYGVDYDHIFKVNVKQSEHSANCSN